MAVPVRRSLLLRSLARRSDRAAGTDGGLEVQIRLRATAHPASEYTRNSRRSPLACSVGTGLLAALGSAGRSWAGLGPAGPPVVTHACWH